MSILRVLLVCSVVAVHFGCTKSAPHAFKIKVAYRNRVNNRMCVQIDSADLPSNHNLVDIGLPFNISKMSLSGQYFEDFKLSNHATDILVVIPGRYKPSCHHYSDCTAIIIIRNELVVSDGSTCFDIAVGDFVHAENVDYVTDFQIRNIIPRTVTCHKAHIDKLLRPQKMVKSVGDIWSPVVDIEKQAVNQVSNVGEQLVTQMNDQFSDIQKEVSNQVAQVSVGIKQEASKLSKNIEEKYENVKEKLDNIEANIVKDVGLMEKIFHYILHAVEIVGTIVIIGFLYRVYKKAKGVYNIFTWIWAKISRGHPRHQNRNMREHIV